MNIFAVPVKRPVATSMFFVGVVLLGIIAWIKLPVELIPPLEGNNLYVNFLRPGSEPEVVEREILLPLASRVAELLDVEETEGSVRGSGGSFTVRFEAESDIKVRELELRRIAAELARTQPPGTFIDVQAVDLSVASRFVMVISVTGMDDLDALRGFIEDRVQHRLAAVTDVSQAMVMGGAPREVTVRIDSDRCAMLGITPNQVSGALQRAVGREQYLGGLEDDAGRTVVILDGRPPGLVTLAATRIDPARAIQLRHVADIDEGVGRRLTVSRVDGKPSIAMIVFQDEGANLIRLGKRLRQRLVELEQEFAEFGLGFSISFDGAELVEERLDRLKTLGLSGFFIALLVLFLFLRQWRAVSVVAVAVPVSLLGALALLYLDGQTLNLITIFGLAVGIGMLVDNSIVVYEAVQRQLERGAHPDGAAEEGVRRTVRAILAASITTIVVFLPISFIEFEQAMVRSFLQVLTLALILPLVASVVVAVGLVPLLARRLAAPAALKRLARLRVRRRALAGLHPPDRGREIFSGLLVVALRRPGAWLTGVAAAVILTAVVAIPLVAFSALSQAPTEANPVQFAAEFPADASLDVATEILGRLEEDVKRLGGVERVESFVQEANAVVNGSVTVYLDPLEERPEGLNAARIREIIRRNANEIAQQYPGFEVRNPGEGGGDGGGPGGGGGIAALLGEGPSEIVVSGPDAEVLDRLAKEIGSQVASTPEVESFNVSGRKGQDEVRVIPDERSLASFGLTSDQVLPVLAVLRREGVQMQIGYVDRDGKEIPLTLRNESDRRRAAVQLGDLRVATPAGVLPLTAVSTVRKMPPPATIQHRNGRRELSVFYSYGQSAPQTGPARADLERRIEEAIQKVRRPVGYTLETPGEDDAVDWFKRILVPVLLLLFTVLAVTFESLTLPLLVLVALPLTLLGATWALVFTGTPADTMALVGIVALVGLTVNPAILLVDRMQQRVRTGATSAGAAALAAVRERARPVLMTSATTVAGLWPLALVTGRENEIWPPFATVVMGGLLTSTLLTLLVIPVGFVILSRLDRLFGRLGPWIMIGWVGATALVMTPVITGGLVTSMTWKIGTTVLVAAMILAIIALVLYRPERPVPEATDGPPSLVVRFLKKTYGAPGPVGYAWRLPEMFAKRVLARGGQPFDPASARDRIVPFVALMIAAGFLARSVQSPFWQLVFLFVGTVFTVSLLQEIRRARGKTDVMGRVDPGGPEGIVALMVPWVTMSYIVFSKYVYPKLAEERGGYDLWFVIALGVIVLVVQQGRRTAIKIARGEIAIPLEEGRLRRLRTVWRKFSRRVFGLDLPRDEVKALSHCHLTAERGMIGVLGPNGAGKTTLLRQLAGILEPTLGTIHIGGVRLEKLKRHLARYVGYLPQDFGLPVNLTAREYLEYYALLYEMKPAAKRQERVQMLLDEVGLGERADEKIGGYSGGMRQRVAVARTLLRLPPIIIVDEPTVGLDPRERIRFRNLLSRLSEGRVVLFSTHVVEDVAVACDRVVVFSKGRMVFDGPPMDLAQMAEGHVWKARLLAEEESELPASAMVVDHLPEGGGQVLLRILCKERPHAAAEPEPPSLEDGYLMLTGSRGVPA